MAETFTSTHRFARISPTKVRPVAALIRKLPVVKAEECLRFMPNRGAKFLSRVLKTAMANAEENRKDRRGGPVGSMRVLEVRVDEGPRIKRIRPRARGMAFMILKRLSHIQIIIGHAATN